MMNRKSLMISTMLMSAVGVGVGVGEIGNVWAADKHWHWNRLMAARYICGQRNMSISRA